MRPDPYRPAAPGCDRGWPQRPSCQILIGMPKPALAAKSTVRSQLKQVVPALAFPRIPGFPDRVGEHAFFKPACRTFKRVDTNWCYTLPYMPAVQTLSRPCNGRLVFFLELSQIGNAHAVTITLNGPAIGVGSSKRQHILLANLRRRCSRAAIARAPPPRRARRATVQLQLQRHHRYLTNQTSRHLGPLSSTPPPESGGRGFLHRPPYIRTLLA